LVDTLDYLRAINLAKSLGDEKLVPCPAGADLGNSMWTMHLGSTQILLKVDGDYEVRFPMSRRSS
jgi:hypothetical protein